MPSVAQHSSSWELDKPREALARTDHSALVPNSCHVFRPQDRTWANDPHFTVARLYFNFSFEHYDESVCRPQHR